MRTRSPTPNARQGRHPALLLLSVVIAGMTSFALLHADGVPRQAAWMAGIFMLAAMLWAMEILPLFATALLTFALEIIFLVNPGDWPGIGFDSGEAPSFREFVGAAADPVLLLFLGGFILARAAVKEGVDVAMSSILLRPFGRRPLWSLLGIILTTGLFSMWMSNTATTAMMLTLVMPMLQQIPSGDPFRKAIVLAVPFASSIGGTGTPIGTPPNAVAIGYLRNSGHPIQFLDWVLAVAPLVIAMLIVTWLLLWRLYPPNKAKLRFEPKLVKLSARGLLVVAVFVGTVLLWLTEGWHGLPAAVVALIPAVVFTATRILGQQDIDQLEWNILILIAGGIALGAGMQYSGMDSLVAQHLASFASHHPTWLFGILILGTITVSTFMSNTAAANLLLPIGVSVAFACQGSGVGMLQITMGIALASSLDMILPISTPPNAIAYATGEVTTRDMAIPGIILAIVGGALILLFGEMMLEALGMQIRPLLVQGDVLQQFEVSQDG